jgi:hypothetical protein
MTKFLNAFKSIPVTPSLPTSVPGGVPGAGAGAGGIGALAVAGLGAVAASGAAVASIVAIAAVAYSSIVPKGIQAAISQRLGEFGKKAGEAGTATGAGGAYNAGGATMQPISDYLNRVSSNVQDGVVEGFKATPPLAPVVFNTKTDLVVDGRVLASVVDQYLGEKYGAANPTRNGAR